MMKKLLLTLLACCGCYASTASAQQPAAPDPILAGEDIREARGLIEIPTPPQWPWYTAAAAGALTMAGLVFWMWRRRSKDKTLNAYDIALAELEAARVLLRTETVERFSTVVSDTLRRYIASRFGITAPHKTTEEFLSALAEAKDSPLTTYRDPLQQFLSACDAAKFAKAMLTNDDMRLLITKAREFLDATRASGHPAMAAAPQHPNITPLTA
ncbi:MAG: DUF4381 family protein [Verrucomicrobiae bacterium]|nr:DUF4381 family protein [Verrucomicrobiae bacterium]